MQVYVCVFHCSSIDFFLSLVPVIWMNEKQNTEVKRNKNNNNEKTKRKMLNVNVACY